MIVTAPESLAVSGDIEDRLNCVYAWFQSCWFKYIDRFLPPCEGRIKTGSGSSDSGYGIPRSALMGADRHAVDVEADTGKPFGGVTCATIRRKVNKNRFLVGMAFGIGVWFVKKAISRNRAGKLAGAS